MASYKRVLPKAWNGEIEHSAWWTLEVEATKTGQILKIFSKEQSSHVSHLKMVKKLTPSMNKVLICEQGGISEDQIKEIL